MTVTSGVPTAPPLHDRTEEVRSDIAGVVLCVHVAVGDRVREGDEVALLESMKMEIPVIAETSGEVVTVDVEPGTAVQVDHVVAVLRPLN